MQSLVKISNKFLTPPLEIPSPWIPLHKFYSVFPANEIDQIFRFGHSKKIFSINMYFIMKIVQNLKIPEI